MLIRYGCELSVIVEGPSPTFCLVDVHPDRRRDIVEERPFHASPSMSIDTTSDAFGKSLRRCVLALGETKFLP